MRRYSCAPQGISLRKMMCQCCGTFFLWQFVCSHHKVYHFCFTTHKLRCKLRVCLDWGYFKVKIQELENRGKEVQVFGTREMPIPFLRNSVARCWFHGKQKIYSDPMVFLPSHKPETASVRIDRGNNKTMRCKEEPDLPPPSLPMPLLGRRLQLLCGRGHAFLFFLWWNEDTPLSCSLRRWPVTIGFGRTASKKRYRWVEKE